MIKLDYTIQTDINGDYFYRIYLEKWQQRVSYSEMTNSKLLKVGQDRFKDEDEAKDKAEREIESIYKNIFFYTV